MHNQVNEEDAPNTIAIYVVLAITLLTLIVTFYGLSEYRAWLTMNREAETNALPFEKREARQEAEAPNLKIIDKTLKEAKKEDFDGL